MATVLELPGQISWQTGSTRLGYSALQPSLMETFSVFPKGTFKSKLAIFETLHSPLWLLQGVHFFFFFPLAALGLGCCAQAFL